MSNRMKHSLAVAGCLALIAVPGAAQSAASPAPATTVVAAVTPVANRPAVGLSFYKILPGRQDEWLALFKKWYYPVMQEMMREGALAEFRLFKPYIHGKGAGWDFAVMEITATPKVRISEAERIRKVFPDLDGYEKAAKERAALVVDHWDDVLKEMDINAEPLSVYRPAGK
ncbi:MAG: hypothetical protein JSR19_06410 [Proteobacteria bacterium]|nr:hypothetical protein [Pseudomonadota bacterium]HQR05031.1 hypothetical protein [Rhodocyclaceae bacterium]